MQNTIKALCACLHSWGHGRRAATAIEYGLIAGGIALVIVASVFLMGGSLSSLFSTIAGAMTDSADKVASR